MTQHQSTANKAVLLEALDQVGEAVYTVSDGQIEAVNRELLELTGYDREALVGERPTILYHPETLDERKRRLQLLREDAEQESVEWLCRFVSKTGTELPVQLEQTAYSEKGSVEGLICQVADIREHHQQEQKLNILTRVLRHNIRNQMNLIVGHATTLQEIEEPNYRTAAETIEEVGERVINLAEKVRKAQEHLDIPPDEECRVELGEITALVVDKFAIAQPQSTVQTDVPDRALALAPPSCEVALMELMENAAVHHKTGSGPVRVRIECERETIAIHVEDECDPISQEVIETIDKGEEQPLRHNDGLGLWIARWIVDTVNGELAFSRREDNSGNRVTLRFDRLDADGAGQ